MLAVRIHEREDVRIEDLETPVPEPGKVLLAGGYTGICGTDVHLYFAPDTVPLDFRAPAKLTGAMWPQILGHEFSGRVAEIGAGVTGLRRGDAVSVFPLHICGECQSCRGGMQIACHHMAFEGINGRSGGMATTKLVDADSCFLLPDTVDLKLGALVEPMAVGWHGVELAEPEPDGGALILGGGPIGVGCYFALRAHGVRTVIVSEPSQARRGILSALGIDHVLDPVAVSLPNAVAEITAGAGVAVALDCAGAPAAFSDAIRALGVRGRLVIVAVYETAPTLDVPSLLGEKVILMSALYTRNDFRSVIDAMGRGLYRVDGGWIETTDFTGVESALQDLRAGRHMKVLVQTEAGR